MKQFLPLTACAFLFVGCTKVGVTPKEEKHSAKADLQTIDPKHITDKSEPRGNPYINDFSLEALRSSQPASDDTSKAIQADKLLKSRVAYAKSLVSEIIDGMKEDEFIRKNPDAIKSTIRSKPEHGVSVYSVQTKMEDSYSSTWYFYNRNLVGLTRGWKPNDDCDKRHDEIMKSMGKPEVDNVKWNDPVAREFVPHNYSWSVPEADLFVQYEVSTFTGGWSQYVTVCSVTGVGRDIGLIGFTDNFIEHFKNVSPTKSLASSSGVKVDVDALKFLQEDPAYGKLNSTARVPKNR